MSARTTITHQMSLVAAMRNISISSIFHHLPKLIRNWVFLALSGITDKFFFVFVRHCIWYTSPTAHSVNVRLWMEHSLRQQCSSFLPEFWRTLVSFMHHCVGNEWSYFYFGFSCLYSVDMGSTWFLVGCVISQKKFVRLFRGTHVYLLVFVWCCRCAVVTIDRFDQCSRFHCTVFPGNKHKYTWNTAQSDKRMQPTLGCGRTKNKLCNCYFLSRCDWTQIWIDAGTAFVVIFVRALQRENETESFSFQHNDFPCSYLVDSGNTGIWLKID